MQNITMQVTENINKEDWKIADLHAKKIEDDYWTRGEEME
jgi:hypothetical protein